MNGGFALDADNVVILMGIAITAGMSLLGGRLVRRGRRQLGGLALLMGVLAGLATYFFATFSIRLM